jgi:hypothetical protein
MMTPADNYWNYLRAVAKCSKIGKNHLIMMMRLVACFQVKLHLQFILFACLNTECRISYYRVLYRDRRLGLDFATLMYKTILQQLEMESVILARPKLLTYDNADKLQT